MTNQPIFNQTYRAIKFVPGDKIDEFEREADFIDVDVENIEDAALEDELDDELDIEDDLEDELDDDLEDEAEIDEEIKAVEDEEIINDSGYDVDEFDDDEDLYDDDDDDFDDDEDDYYEDDYEF